MCNLIQDTESKIFPMFIFGKKQKVNHQAKNTKMHTNVHRHKDNAMLTRYANPCTPSILSNHEQPLSRTAKTKLRETIPDRIKCLGYATAINPEATVFGPDTQQP